MESLGHYGTATNELRCSSVKEKSDPQVSSAPTPGGAIHSA